MSYDSNATVNCNIRASGWGGPQLTLEGNDSGVITTIQRSAALVRGLRIILQHHGASEEIQSLMEIQINDYLNDTEDEEVWLKRCKYLLTFPLAQYLRNELPSPPPKPFRFRGSLWNWVKARFERPSGKGFNHPNTHLWYSWFQTKRSTLPLSDEVIESTYDKHLEMLTKDDLGDDQTIEDILNVPEFQELLHRVSISVRDKLIRASPFEERMPSKNACFESQRSLGGQQGELRRFCGLDHIDDGPYLNGTEFHSMIFKPWVYTSRGIRYNMMVEARCATGLEFWQTLSESALLYDRSKPLCCTIQAVLEPNKVRVISKGNALPYYSCRPLQNAMHSTLRVMAPFRLLDRPFCPTDMIGLAEKAKKTDKWFSVDYSAATDGLSYKYSGRIFEEVIRYLPETQKEMARLVLGPHALHYPIGGKGGCREFRGLQRNGQLMGSILSFPILCLANIGLYLLNTRDSHFGWSYEERMNHVLVNGDDMIYAADSSLWMKHAELGKKVGLEMSVGKAYIHREYANVNSTSVHFPLQREGALRCPYQINYLNTGLFFGQHKVQNKTEVATAHMSDRTSDGLVTNLNCLLQGAKPGKQSDILRMFLEVHKDRINAECSIKTSRGERFHRNLFIPLQLGGMGVKAPDDWKFSITKLELHVAHGFIRLLPECAYTSQLPIPGYAVQKVEDRIAMPWDTTVERDPSDRVPVRKITFKRLKSLCRIGFVRFGPFEGVSQA
nr:MAG: RNA-dependent RNA polymerase [Riboviria sp.]